MTQFVSRNQPFKSTGDEQGKRVIQQFDSITDNNPWPLAHQPSVPMDCLIRFVQIHETFRKPEIEALALLTNVNVEFLFYTESVCLDFLG